MESRNFKAGKNNWYFPVRSTIMYTMKRKKRNRINTGRLILMGAALFVLLILLLAMIRFVFWSGQPDETGGGRQGAEADEDEIRTPEPTLLNIYAHFDWQETTEIRVYDHRADEIVTMDLEEYVVGVVSAEMPAWYELEALKSQAVATRTYTLYRMQRGGCQTNPDADVCTNSKCCQAFSSHERMQNTWGSDYVTNYNRVATAVMATAGEVVTYNGKLCDALYHACSGGQTEDSEHVYANALPYLRGVDSPYEDPMREEDVELGIDALVELITAKYPESGITAENAKDEIKIRAAYNSGRVETLQLGKTQITGKNARNLFGLRSTMFTVAWTEKGIVFHTKGFGHGVGLSQNGANGMAKHGSDYREILLHYYTGVEITSYDADGTVNPIPDAQNTDVSFVPEG